MSLVGELIVKGNIASGIRTQAFQVRRRVREINLSLEGLRLCLLELGVGEHWLTELDGLTDKIAQVDEFAYRWRMPLRTQPSPAQAA